MPSTRSGSPSRWGHEAAGARDVRCSVIADGVAKSPCALFADGTSPAVECGDRQTEARLEQPRWPQLGPATPRRLSAIKRALRCFYHWEQPALPKRWLASPRSIFASAHRSGQERARYALSILALRRPFAEERERARPATLLVRSRTRRWGFAPPGAHSTARAHSHSRRLTAGGDATRGLAIGGHAAALCGAAGPTRTSASRKEVVNKKRMIVCWCFPPGRCVLRRRGKTATGSSARVSSTEGRKANRVWPTARRARPDSRVSAPVRLLRSVRSAPE
jgi:hypothetical protein